MVKYLPLQRYKGKREGRKQGRRGEGRNQVGEGRLFGSVLSAVISGGGRKLFPVIFIFFLVCLQNFYSEHLSLFIIKKSLKN